MQKSKSDDFFQNEKYGEFIEETEDQWLQYAHAEERMKAFFGTYENALKMYELWLDGHAPYEERKDLMWSLEGRKN